MDSATVVQLIGSLGFPIACCIYLIYTHKLEAEETNKTISELRKVVENNTKAVIRLYEKLGGGVEELE